MDDLSATFSEYFTNKGHDGYVFKDPITGEVREHIGEMPLPWGEYPDNIEPESKEAAAYDLSRGAVRALPSQIIERNFLASQGELPEGSQIDDPYWITASKVLHDYMGHSDFKQALQKRPGIRPNQTEPMTPEDYAEWGVGFMSQFNWNMSAMLINTAKLADAPAEVAKSMYYLMETSDRTGMNFSNFTQGMGNLFKDPTTYVGLGTFGIGVAGKVAGKQMTKAALKQVLKDIVLSKPTTATLAVGVEGAMYGAADDLARQTVETRVTGEDISLGQAATSATVGAVAGERFAAGLPAVGEAVVRGGKQIAENLQREGEMPTLGSNFGNVFAPKDNIISEGGLPIAQEKGDENLRLHLQRLASVNEGKSEYPGAPKNERTVIKAPENSGLPDVVVGKIKPDDWQRRIEQAMSPSEINEADKWYKIEFDEFQKQADGDP